MKYIFGVVIGLVFGLLAVLVELLLSSILFYVAGLFVVDAFNVNHEFTFYQSFAVALSVHLVSMFFRTKVIKSSQTATNNDSFIRQSSAEKTDLH